MITYAIISSSLFAAWDNRELLYGIGDSIRTGDVAVFLLKPLRYPLYLFAVETGRMLFMLLAVVVPTTLIIGLIYGIQPPASTFHAAFFGLYWAQSFLLLFLLSALCGLLAFWLMTSFSLDWIFRAFMQLLSGMFVPLWFFPPGFADVAQHLPFAWIGYYPTAVYLGKLDTADTVLYFGYGALWTLAAAAAVAALWSRASGRLVVQGG
jgi:ABC-2 type transport system permease protein